MNTPNVDHSFSVAPMLDWTDRHCRYFLRLISKRALLYTEMVTTGAIIHGSGDYLSFNAQEHPVVLQLGGSDPKDMAFAAQKAQDYGYDEVNINVGCPSDRVQNGAFGACLMLTPERVAECIRAMQSNVNIPVTVKSRIGVDEQDSYTFLTDFIKTVEDTGCETFILHARKAWLKGLSPKQNREIPELIYDRVYQVKTDFPHLNISINGGVKTLAEAKSHLQYVDGVMVGREVYQNPYFLANVDREIFGEDHDPLTRHQIVEQMLPYIEAQMEKGSTVWHVVRHMLGLFNGIKGAKAWRRHLSENARFNQSDVVEQALSFVDIGHLNEEQFS